MPKIILSGTKKMPIPGIAYSNMEGSATIELEFEDFDVGLADAKQKLEKALSESFDAVLAVKTKETEAEEKNKDDSAQKNIEFLKKFITKNGLDDQWREFVKSIKNNG